MVSLTRCSALRARNAIIGVSGTCISTVHPQSFPHCHNRSISIFQTNHPCFHGMSTCMLQFAAAVLSISYMVWYSCIVSSFPPTLSWPKLPQHSHLKSIRKRSFTPQCNGSGPEVGKFIADRNLSITSDTTLVLAVTCRAWLRRSNNGPIGTSRYHSSPASYCDQVPSTLLPITSVDLAPSRRQNTSFVPLKDRSFV